MIGLLAAAQQGGGAGSTAVLVALIGMPAALVTAIGTVWFIAKRGNGNGSKPVSPTNGTNGYRFVTQRELKVAVDDMRDEMRSMEERQNAKLDLIVTLIRNGSRGR